DLGRPARVAPALPLARPRGGGLAAARSGLARGAGDALRPPIATRGARRARRGPGRPDRRAAAVSAVRGIVAGARAGPGDGARRPALERAGARLRARVLRRSGIPVGVRTGRAPAARRVPARPRAVLVPRPAGAPDREDRRCRDSMFPARD